MRRPGPSPARRLCYDAVVRSRSLLLSALLAGGCSSPSAGDASSTRRPDDRDVPTTPTVDADEPRQDTATDEGAIERQARISQLEAVGRRMFQELASARGVTTRDDGWQVDLLDRAGVRSFVDAELTKQSSDAEIVTFGRIESVFGLIPANIDARELLLDMYESSVLGLYDPDRKTLFVGAFVPERMLQLVIGHELAHGVQDARFDLTAYQTPIRPGPRRGDNDRELARTFLIEGDAHATYMSWLAGPAGPAGLDDAAAVAAVDQVLALDGASVEYPALTRIMQLPYVAGTATVMQLARERGWDAVDALYAALPASSEQMLHLEKLLSEEPPASIAFDADQLGDAFGAYRVEWTDNRGEATWLATLAGPGRIDTARRACAGWHGDLFVALTDGTDAPPLIAGITVWDSVDDAREFSEALTIYPSPSSQQMPHIAHRRVGDRVYYVFAPPSLADALLRDAERAFTLAPIQERVER